MKKTIKILKAMRSIAIIALVAVIGLAMTGCGDKESAATYRGYGLDNLTVAQFQNASAFGSGQAPSVNAARIMPGTYAELKP